MTFPSLVDALIEAKRTLVRLPAEEIVYNSMYVCADELGAFMHKWDEEMTKGLSAFYDPDPYSHHRRTKELKLTIESPQLNLLCGTTPQDLMDLMPENAWGQGFTSRLIMVFSDERLSGDDFAVQAPIQTDDLAHDLKLIANLYGKFEVTSAYRDRVREWQKLGEPPIPNHPRLLHYNGRRRVNLYKLSMIASVERNSSLTLTLDDFNRAYDWLCEAETYMPDIFKAGATNADGQAMDEIEHFVRISDQGQGVPDHKIVHFARERIPIHSILRVIEIMEKSGQIELIRTSGHLKVRHYRIPRTLH
jgi:hypothetical protein